jgi:hypothetical protein
MSHSTPPSRWFEPHQLIIKFLAYTHVIKLLDVIWEESPHWFQSGVGLMPKSLLAASEWLTGHEVLLTALGLMLLGLLLVVVFGLALRFAVLPVVQVLRIMKSSGAKPRKARPKSRQPKGNREMKSEDTGGRSA